MRIGRIDKVLKVHLVLLQFEDALVLGCKFGFETLDSLRCNDCVVTYIDVTARRIAMYLVVLLIDLRGDVILLLHIAFTHDEPVGIYVMECQQQHLQG